MGIIYRGDARAVLQTLPSESVNCVVTSPPYWWLRNYGVDGQIGLEPIIGEYVSRLVEVFRGVRRVLREDGTVWLNMGDSYAADRGGTNMPAETLAGGVGGVGEPKSFRGRQLGGTHDKDGHSLIAKIAHRNAPAIGLKHKDLVGVPWRVAFALQSDGWYLRQDIIWHKPNPMPESVRDRCTKAHEYMFLLSKNERYYYDIGAMKEPALCGSKGSHYHTGKTGGHQQGRASTKQRKPAYWDAGSGGHGTIHREGRSSTVEYSFTQSEYRNKRSVWTVPTQPFAGAHFATFPTELIRPCIRAGCPPGGTVLDPFIGSGTTAVVAIQEGRDYIGIELNPEYVEMANRRILDTQEGLPL